jgi:hypothetical protein
MAAVMGTVRVSNLLVQGDVDVGGCLHPPCTTWDDCHRCTVVRLGVTHDPKRKKVALDAVVAVVPR